MKLPRLCLHVMRIKSFDLSAKIRINPHIPEKRTWGSC